MEVVSSLHRWITILLISRGAPGIEEEYMLNYILDWSKRRVRVVVWDTAPAGHSQASPPPSDFSKNLEAATKFYMNLYSYFEKYQESVKFKKGKKSLLEIISGWEGLAGKSCQFHSRP